MLKSKGIIRLRQPHIKDLNDLLNWENDILKIDHTDMPVFYTKDQMINYLKSSQDLLINGQVRYIITLDEKSIGFIDLYDFDVVHSRAGIGIFLDKNFRRKGVGKKALVKLIEITKRELHLNQLFAEVFQSNKPAISLFKHVGFTLSGMKKQWIRKQEAYEDLLFLQLLNTQFQMY